VNYHSIDCLCGPDCQNECCRRKNYGRQPLDPEKTDEKVEFVPKGTSGDNCSVSSYGSTDSTEPLLRGGIQVCHSPNGGPSFVVNSDRSSLDKSVRCECHVKVVDDTTRKAKIKLVTACLVALLFMIGEVIGKFFRWSLTGPGASCMRLLKILCDHSSLCAIISCTCIISAISYTIEINKWNILVCITQWSDALFVFQEFKLTSYMGRCV